MIMDSHMLAQVEVQSVLVTLDIMHKYTLSKCQLPSPNDEGRSGASEQVH